MGHTMGVPPVVGAALEGVGAAVVGAAVVGAVGVGVGAGGDTPDRLGTGVGANVGRADGT